MESGKSVSIDAESLRELSDKELGEIATDVGEQHRKAVADIIAADFTAKHTQLRFEDSPDPASFVEAGVQAQIARNARARVEALIKTFQPLFAEIERRRAAS